MSIKFALEKHFQSLAFQLGCYDISAAKLVMHGTGELVVTATSAVPLPTSPSQKTLVFPTLPSLAYKTC